MTCTMHWPFSSCVYMISQIAFSLIQFFSSASPWLRNLLTVHIISWEVKGLNYRWFAYTVTSVWLWTDEMWFLLLHMGTGSRLLSFKWIQTAPIHSSDSSIGHSLCVSFISSLWEYKHFQCKYFHNSITNIYNTYTQCLRFTIISIVARTYLFYDFIFFTSHKYNMTPVHITHI